MSCRLCIASLMVAIFHCVGSVQLTAQSYDLVDLRTLGGVDDYSSPNAINELAQIAGFENITNPTRAFIWDAASGMTDLGHLAGYNRSRALGLNDLGVAVGWSSNPATKRAVKWSGGPTSLPLLPTADLSEAWAINNSGEICGYCRLGTGSHHACLWTNSGTVLDLGVPPRGRRFQPGPGSQ